MLLEHGASGVNAKFFTVGAISAAVSFMFGVSVAIFLLAFFGACCALMVSQKDRTFLRALLFVIISTSAGALGASGFTFVFPGFPERLSSFVIALMAFPFIEGLIEVAGTLPKRIRDKWM